MMGLHEIRMNCVNWVLTLGEEVSLERRTIDLQEGWDLMQKGITKLKNILEGLPEPQFSSEDYMMLWTTIYNMCTQKPPHDYSQQLYDKYRESFEEYITSTVLPSLREKHDEFMLRELVKRWANHKVMVRWLSRFFHYLDRYFIARRSLPGLNEVGLTCFRELVYQELNEKVRDAVISLIDQEREGEQIDRALLKNVLGIFVEIRMGQMDYYENDFEASMLKDTAGYYSRKASNWILEDSCPDYMLKAEECLKREKDRVSHYLRLSSELKLLEKVQHELLSVFATQLLEKEHSGCHALLRDDKVGDLSRMFRLFSKIPQGLDPVSSIFRQHVTAEGIALVKQAEDAASNRKVDKKDVVGMQEQVFVGKVIELHDKCLAYMNDCFQNHTLFHKALKIAFQEFWGKGVAGISCSEILASFCDNIIRTGVEETLRKVEDLLDYITYDDSHLFAKFYWKKMAQRLLFYKNANVYYEEFVLTQLRQHLQPFIKKMGRMLRDVTLAKQNRVEFEYYLRSIIPYTDPQIDLTVTVLTDRCWPCYKSFPLKFPTEMVKCVKAFTKFYQTKMNCRKLTWISSLGTCKLIGNFEPKSMELVVTTPQACALLLFNEFDRITYSDIKALLKLPDKDLFTDGRKRIKISMPPLVEKKVVVDKETYVQNRIRRSTVIGAAIVRIMKMHKVLGFQQLKKELKKELKKQCLEQLHSKLKLHLGDFKMQIESLIQREYLVRDKSDPNLFRYKP
ncbi:hypothetical protein SLA2020_509100 [Shorea laevis]